MARETPTSELGEELLVPMLREARDDVREGRLVRCADEAAIRKFFEELHARPA